MNYCFKHAACSMRHAVCCRKRYAKWLTHYFLSEFLKEIIMAPNLRNRSSISSLSAVEINL
ncbi:hypothetical protein DSECCO2_517800 [anaerobic digester metagenome]